MALLKFESLYLLPIVCLLQVPMGSLGHELSRPGIFFVDPAKIQDSVASPRMPSLVETGLLDFWNSSWPSLIKKEQEKNTRFEMESSERPYSISPKCAMDIVGIVNGLVFHENWAFKMIDASGKFPSGILLGSWQWLGTYSECVSISSDKPNATSIKGGYCMMSIGPEDGSLNSTIRLGICLPQTCNSTDAKALINILMIGVTRDIYATGSACTDNSTLPLDSGAIAVIVILSILGLLVALGTCLDICYQQKQKSDKIINYSERLDDDDDDDDEPLLTGVSPGASEVIVQSLGTNGVSSESISTAPGHPTAAPQHRGRGVVFKFLIAFAFFANVRKIFSTERSQEHEQLQALHGIRFISMTWVILGHSFLSIVGSSSNIVSYVGYLKRFTFEAIINASVSVDTFFLMSGMLVSYMLLKEMRDRDGPREIGWLKFFFHRFWRLTPLYMMVLAVYTTLLKYFGSGPYWDRTSDKNCQAHWWTNLLYINNIVHVYEPCIAWTWYLANDMQFFLLSPLFIVLLYKWTLFGYIAVFVFMLTSWITTGVLTYVNHFPPSIPGIMQNISNQDHWFNQVYITPWCRISPYLIGILLGYMLYKTNCRLKLPTAAVVLLWCLAAVCNLSVLYGLYNVARGYYLSPQVSALYASLHRTAWSLGVSWVIIACATGNAGFVNDLLSLPVAIPLSRLTYGAYLVHPIITAWFTGNLKVPFYVDDPTMVYLFLANVTLAYAAAFVVSVVCESPMINLEKSFIRDRNRRR